MMTEVEHAEFFEGDDGRCSIKGRMTFETVPHLLRRMRPALTAGNGAIIVDMAGVDHADSAGMALLLELLRIAKGQGRKIDFINLPAQLSRLVRVSQLEHVFSNLDS